jgi:hypothetical protein
MNRRKAPKFPYNEALVTRMLSFVTAGCHPDTAAEAAGIPVRVFRAWIERRDGVYYKLKQRVISALATATARAEISVYDENPEHWLKYGPGQDGPFKWQTDPRIVNRTVNKQINNTLVMDSDEATQVAELQKAVLEALADMPEARAKVAARLMQLGKPKQLTLDVTPSRKPKPNGPVLNITPKEDGGPSA